MAEIKAVDTGKTNAGVEKKSKGKGGCLIVLLILFLTPLLVLGGIYLLNKDFKMSVNSIMTNVPGPMGEYFSKFPTREEEKQQISVVSDFILSLEESRAVDKLLILKKDDKTAYDEVIKDMLRVNPNKTKSILEALRLSTVNKDALSNTVSGITEEQKTSLKEKADYISGLPIDVAVSEVNAIINESINGHKNAAAVFEYIEEKIAVSILYQLDQVDRERILSMMTEKKASAIRTTYSNQQRRVSDLEQISDVYSSEDPAKLIEIIGNTTTYSMDDLAVIYKKIGAKKAGQILAKSEDEAFVFDLIAKIKANETFEGEEDLLTPDILKSLKIYREFDDNVSELIKVYSEMDTAKVVQIVKNMLLNASPSQVYDLDNGEMITISDEDLILQILKSFPQEKIASILSSLDQTLSSELTRKLALPKK